MIVNVIIKLQLSVWNEKEPEKEPEQNVDGVFPVASCEKAKGIAFIFCIKIPIKTKESLILLSVLKGV